VSETTFYRRLVEKFKKLLRFIPYAGTISGLLATGAHTIEKAMRKAASMALPLARYLNAALRKGQETVRYLIPFYSLKAAASTLEENMPRAQLTVPSKALLLRQARSVQKNITEPQGPDHGSPHAETGLEHQSSRTFSS
jgi:hypothetical protein